MKVLGLTGGIATGKSTAARMIGWHGVHVFDADACVHEMMKNPQVIEEIEKYFPDAVKQGDVDRRALGEHVFGDEHSRAQLESVLHPRVRAAEYRFLFRHQRAHTPVVLLDIPLLFESGADELCDWVLCATCPRFLQAQRALRRPGMTAQKLRQIIAAQMDEHERIHRSDAILSTGIGKAHTMRQIKRLLRELNVA